MTTRVSAWVAAMTAALLGFPTLTLAAQPPPRFAVPHFNFVRLEVLDAAKTVEFYVKGVGLHERGQVSATEVFVGFDDDPTSTALNVSQRRSGAAAPAASVNLCFVVNDLAQTLTHVTAAGGKIVTPTRRLDVPGALIDVAYIDDLDGNHVELMQYLRLGAAATTTATTAQAVAAPPQKLPDWSGIWNPAETNIFDPTARAQPQNRTVSSTAYMREFPPYNAQWEARYKQTLADNVTGKPTDPTAGCVPGGMPRVMTTPYPFEFVIQPGRVLILHEISSQVRRIWTDGRKHPDDLDPTYMGHSIGHWEGDTLVVDTIGMRGDTVFDVTAAPHSDKIHVTERIRRLSPTRLEDRFSVEDPVAFTKPWLVVRTYDLKPNWQITEYVCEENNRNPINPDGSTGFIRPK